MTVPVCVQYINLPTVPKWVVDTVPADWHADKCLVAPPEYGAYVWSDQGTDVLNTWCKANICDTIHWAWQFMTSDIAVHKDRGTAIKFCYLLESGGDCVTTKFFDDDQTTEIFQTQIQLHRWHLLQADRFHSVENIQPGQRRLAITGRVF